MHTTARRLAAGIVAACGLSTLIGYAFATAPAGSAPTQQPHFDPAYVPSLDDAGQPHRPSVATYCASATTMAVRFQPWNDSTGWLGVYDTTSGTWVDGPGEWPSGRTVELAQRAGFELHYWSGSSNDPAHPDGNGDPGHYLYRVVPGNCAEPPAETTTTTQPVTTTTEPTTTTSEPEPTTTTTEPTTTTAPPETTTTQPDSTTTSEPTLVTIPSVGPGPDAQLSAPRTGGQLVPATAPGPGALATTGPALLVALLAIGVATVVAGFALHRSFKNAGRRPA